VVSWEARNSKQAIVPKKRTVENDEQDLRFTEATAEAYREIYTVAPLCPPYRLPHRANARVNWARGLLPVSQATGPPLLHLCTYRLSHALSDKTADKVQAGGLYSQFASRCSDLSGDKCGLDVGFGPFHLESRAGISGSSRSQVPAYRRLSNARLLYRCLSGVANILSLSKDALDARLRRCGVDHGAFLDKAAEFSLPGRRTIIR
jgi:hypothetical protein